MKRIRQIIEALKVLSRTPSKTIRAAADDVLRIAGGNGRGEKTADDNNFNLISNLLDAVVAIAEDMEKPLVDRSDPYPTNTDRPAKAEGEPKSDK